MTSPTTNSTALITGASSGIGAIYAERLAHRGYNLVLVARNRERLDRIAVRLADETGRTIEIIQADLNKAPDLARVEKVLQTDASINLLINNAGLGAVGPLLASKVDKMVDIINLNVVALTRLSYAIAPGFVARGGGSIINIASIVGLAPELLNGVYGASKAYVIALSRSLKQELAEKNVYVQAVLPGATATDFWELSGKPVSELDSAIVMSAEDMVDAALVAFDQQEFITIPALPEIEDWNAYEAARQKLLPNLSRQHPATRYRVIA
ncbi:SDR family oxidoreductase [Phyllobacterium sp. SB3]|uniref:SDR family NAD(P)-dependent oxidoreductase n=1 Tax=Phyllobacterium sp. SB3 TaxID=3156073 RepID=UPI0032AFAE33